MILIRGKEGLIHRTGKDIQNVFQNLFKQRGKWRRKAKELAPYYSTDAPRLPEDGSPKKVICLFDGRIDHCGMTDRLRGIVSAYDVAKQLGYDFRIWFVNPFRLEDYLLPNEVDWRIDESEISYNPADSHVMYCGSNDTHVERFFQRLWFKKCFQEAPRQVHVYTNAHLLPYGQRFGRRFRRRACWRTRRNRTGCSLKACPRRPRRTALSRAVPSQPSPAAGRTKLYCPAAGWILHHVTALPATAGRLPRT